ncbi:MAG: hypothetical protein HOY79_46845 [Streptomyces sp.]|nr:hypothetical protein [Streptomyces sp.]
MTVVLEPAPPSPAVTPVGTLFTLDLPDYGKLVVREQFDLHRGEAHFKIVKGARASGTFTISAYRWGLVAIPTSVGVWYGRGDAAASPLDRTDRPVVNGVELAGGTHWTDPERWHTFDPVDNVRVHTPTSRISSVPAPERTQHRAGTIVLALLGQYVQHPLRPVLQRVAAEYAAAQRLRDLGSVVGRLHSEIAEKQEAIGRLEVQIADYERLETELRELADGYAQRVEDEQAGDRT